MHQLTLDELRRARMTDPETSKASAARSHRLASEHERLILDALAANNRALSAHEIAACCGLAPVQVSRRLGAMRDDGLVLVVDQCGVTPSGRAAQRWRIV